MSPALYIGVTFFQSLGKVEVIIERLQINATVWQTNGALIFKNLTQVLKMAVDLLFE